jgi:chorismate mutase
MSNLQYLRRQLDVIDAQIIELLADRGRVIEGVISYKRDHNLSPVDPTRETKVLAKATQTAAALGLDPRVARAAFRSILDTFALIESEQLGNEE